jgi:hypothetical protein
MRHLSNLVLAAAAALAGTASAAPVEKENRVFELRVYYAAKGKLDALHARFRDHTMKIFENHGMTNVGYWVPIDNKDDRLVYVIAHKDRAAATANWKAFIADPEWKKAQQESEKDGRLVMRADSFFLDATDYSPAVAPSQGKGERVFELRTYITSPNNLDLLNARFRDHTMKLFERHGMTNVAYWTLDKSDKATVGKLLTANSPTGQEKSEVDAKDPAGPLALVYLLGHPSVEARNKTFDAFRVDPDWVKAKGESEKAGSLTAKNGVKSLMMKATDYSPMK